uniref:Protein kinase domain-containing protein n=1 Tax=Rhizophagus irregularis (strain DAOM 181602 / DAOM 197198 / MUCL 43194) TaxID=747089 RepID=U9UUW7_RHIID
MDQQINYKLKIDLDNTSSVNIAQNTFKSKSKYKKCSECNRNKRYFSETHQICCLCYEANKIIIPSGNKVIDDFIRYTITNSSIPRGKMIFVPYNKFKDVEFIAEGGFSKIYKATCVDGLTTNWNPNKHRFSRYEGTEIFALKELNNSKNISSKDLHELKIFYDISLKGGNYVNIHQGITQQNFMIITEYYELGDLTHYIAKRFFNISWKGKSNNG